MLRNCTEGGLDRSGDVDPAPLDRRSRGAKSTAEPDASLQLVAEHLHLGPRFARAADIVERLSFLQRHAQVPQTLRVRPPRLLVEVRFGTAECSRRRALRGPGPVGT